VIHLLKSWVIYGVLLITAGFFNRNQPGYISSLSFYIILFTPLVNLLHVFFSLISFRLVHGVDKREVSKGEEIVYKMKLINPTSILLAPFSLHYISGERLFLELKEEDQQRIIVSEHKRITIRKKLICAYRGIYPLGVDYIVIRDYFNFFRFTYRDVEQHKILVYPKLRELKSNLLKNVMNENNESVISFDSSSQSVFSDVRGYIPGDSLNRIHWKLSAKAGDFITKVYYGQVTNRTKVILDTCHLNLEEEDEIVYEDYMVEGCVSVVHFLLENRVHTDLFYEGFGLHKIEGENSQDFSKFYNDMARLSFYKRDLLIDVIDKVVKMDQEVSHLIVMTQRITIALAEKLIRLKYRNYEISLVVCDVKALDVSAVKGYGDNKAHFMITTSNIPVYLMQHDESSTRLGVA